MSPAGVTKKPAPGSPGRHPSFPKADQCHPTLLDVLLSILSFVRGLLDMILPPFLPDLVVQPSDLRGKTAIVTGSNQGIGFAIASGLAGMGCEVVLACRNESKAESAAERIRDDILLKGLSKDGRKGGARVEVEVLDLASLASVRDFVSRWEKRDEGSRGIDFLVNNAGMICGPESVVDGVNLMYRVNAVSPTMLLLPYLTPAARIINLSSFAHYCGILSPFTGNPPFTSSIDSRTTTYIPFVKRFFNGWAERYANDKLMNVMFACELQKRLDAVGSGIRCHSLQPGIVKTSGLTTEAAQSVVDIPNFVLAQWMSLLGISLSQGAATALHCCVSEDAGRTGGDYWDRMGRRNPNPLVFEGGLRRMLWDRWCRDAGVGGEIRVRG